MTAERSQAWQKFFKKPGLETLSNEIKVQIQGRLLIASSESALKGRLPPHTHGDYLDTIDRFELKAFDIIAEELFKAGCLGDLVLDLIPAMVSEAKTLVAMGSGIDDLSGVAKRTRLRLNHWQGRLLLGRSETIPEGPSQSNRCSLENETEEQRAKRRQAFVMPKLKERKWSRSRLASESGLGKNSVYEYLDGTRATISEANLQAMADVLEIDKEDMPK